MGTTLLTLEALREAFAAELGFEPGLELDEHDSIAKFEIFLFLEELVGGEELLDEELFVRVQTWQDLHTEYVAFATARMVDHGIGSESLGGED